ncbi:MAG: phospholipid carrier-dependent glycosyltransferase [Anaerolineae bacterium]|nr:phospholipid carrier-dependent glycosyltransferase [Anaerolineae bacterium]
MASFQSKQKILPFLVIFILTAYQLVRIIAFINVYGGIEHDGGWMLSISRSLAEQGTYTTMVSTIVDPTVSGAINVDQKFDIQAADGRIWFFTGNGVGPASIIPDAIVLRIFGAGFWALRAGPLIFYTLFLLLVAYILYRLARLEAVVLFHTFLFFYPHISIFLGYEAMGEVPGMFYILAAYLVFAVMLKKPTRRWWHFLLVGLVVGLALNAKMITLWSLSGIFVWGGILWLMGGRRWRQSVMEEQPSARLRFRDVAALGGGTILLPVLWEMVHLIILTYLTNFDLYLQHAQQRLTFILDDGSGVGLQIHSGPEFFWDKFFLLVEVAHPQRWVTGVIFAFIFLGGLALIWLWRSRGQKQNLLAPMWFGWLANTIWFVGLAKTGWARHFWFGLVLGVMLLCVIAVTLPRIRIVGSRRDHRSVSRNFLQTISLAAGVMLLALIAWGFVSQPYVWGFYVPDEIVTYWREKRVNHKYAPIPWIVIPRNAQAEAVNYIQQMPAEANVYYPEGYKVAEIPAQTGRLHFPIGRRNLQTPHPKDVIIFSPSAISPWRKDTVMRQNVLRLIEQVCPEPVVKNDFYIVCSVDILRLP